MGFGEYHHWAYGGVIREKPNYVAYVGMESERVSAPRKLRHEWLQGEKSHWAYRRISGEGENPIEDAKKMFGKRKIKRAK